MVCNILTLLILGVESVERKKYIRKYQEILNNRLCLEISLIRLVHLGLPRSGKTLTQLRLFNMIVDMLTDGIKNQPSTGVAKTYQVIIGLIESQKWSISKNLEEEMGILNELLPHAADPTKSTGDPSRITFSYSSQSGAGQSIPSVQSSSNENPSRGSLTKENIEELYDIFQEARSTQNWDKAIHRLENTIILLNSDTGGQAALLEMLGPLVLGPSLYLVYHRLTDQLDKEYDIWATNDEGVSTEPEESTITVEDFLFQALATISCFSHTKDEQCPEGLNKEALKKCHGLSRRSKAMLVGTFQDEFDKNGGDLKDRDLLLQNKFRGLVEYGSEEQLILPVNNKSGGKADINKLRSALEKAIKRCSGKIKIPASWLMLSLCIRKEGVPTMKLSDCEVLAGKLGIDHDELQIALWFFHHMMGIHFFYKEVKELEDVVICDVKVIFDSITNLVKNSFSFDSAGKAVADHFKETAQFSQDSLDIASSGQTDSLLPLPKLVKLLEYLNILTTLTSSVKKASHGHDKDRIYFMPCLLRSAKASELQVHHGSSDPASLMIQFECVYVPLGVFSATITNIISQKLEDWELCSKKKRNKVQFRIGKGADRLTLISHPKFIEIAFVQSNSCSRSLMEALCSRVRSVMKSTLETVTNQMNYDFNMQYDYAFACPLHPGEDHRCTLANESHDVMKCSRDEEIVFHELSWKHKVWFNGMYLYS